MLEIVQYRNERVGAGLSQTTFGSDLHALTEVNQLVHVGNRTSTCFDFFHTVETGRWVTRSATAA